MLGSLGEEEMTDYKALCPICGVKCNGCEKNAESHPVNRGGAVIHGHWIGDSLKAHTWAVQP